jgi:hypothetical protein
MVTKLEAGSLTYIWAVTMFDVWLLYESGHQPYSQLLTSP